MPYYRVVLYGENFLIRLGFKKRMCGFYTTRYVEAADPDGAENRAVEMIKANTDLVNRTHNKPWQSSWQKQPRIHVEEMYEIEESEMEQQGGYAFFPMEETSQT